jgi:hypothetical protein
VGSVPGFSSISSIFFLEEEGESCPALLKTAEAEN